MEILRLTKCNIKWDCEFYKQKMVIVEFHFRTDSQPFWNRFHPQVGKSGQQEYLLNELVHKPGFNSMNWVRFDTVVHVQYNTKHGL